jgi:hypothetical protein
MDFNSEQPVVASTLAVDAFKIVLQHLLLPRSGCQHYQNLFGLLDQRITSVREKIFEFVWNPRKDPAKVGQWRHDPTSKELEQQYMEKIGYLDVAKIQTLLGSFHQTTCPALLNEWHKLMNIKRTSPKEDPKEEIYSINAISYAANTLNSRFLHPVAWMIQHMVLFVFAQIQHDDIPNIEGNISHWFERQRDHRFPSKNSLKVFQLVAYLQWTQRWELAEISLQGLLLIPLMLEERVESYSKGNLLLDMSQSGKDPDRDFLPLYFCREIMNVYFVRCEELIEFVLAYQENLGKMCQQVLHCMRQFQSAFQALHSLRLPVAWNRVASLDSVDVRIQMNVICNKLTRCFGSDCIAMVTSSRNTLSELYSVLHKCREECEHPDHVSPSAFQPLQSSILQRSSKDMPLSRRSDQVIGKGFSSFQAIQASQHAMLVFGYSSILDSTRPGNAIRIEGLRKTLSEEVLETMINLYRYRCNIITIPSCFDPWNSADRFEAVEVIETAVHYLWKHVYILLHRHIFAPSNETLSSVKEQTKMLLSIERSKLLETLQTAVTTVMLYLVEAFYSKGLTDLDGLQFRYHQGCYEFAQEVVSMRENLMSSMLSIQAEYREDSVGFFTLIFKAGACISNHALTINYSNELYSETTIAKLIQTMALAHAAPVSASKAKTKKNRDHSQQLQQSSPPDAHIARLVALILLLSMRSMVFQQFLTQFLSQVLHAIECERKAGLIVINMEEEPEIDYTERSMFSPETFEHLKQWKVVIQEMKTVCNWMSENMTSDSFSSTWFQEFISVHNIILNVSIICADHRASVQRERYVRTKEEEKQQQQQQQQPVKPKKTGRASADAFPDLKMDETIYVELRALAWQIYSQWLELFHHQTNTVQDADQSNTSGKIRLLTLRRQVLRTRLLLMNTIPLWTHLQSRLQLFNKEDEQAMRGSLSDPLTARRKIGKELLKVITVEFVNVLQVLCVKSYAEQWKHEVSAELDSLTDPVEKGKVFAIASFESVCLQDIDHQLAKVLRSYGETQEYHKTPVNTNVGLLERYLTICEKSLDLYLSAFQFLIHTFVRETNVEASKIEENKSKAANVFSTHKVMKDNGSDGGVVDHKLLRDTIVPHMLKPLHETFDTTAMLTLFHYLLASPFIYSVDPDPRNQKSSVSDCRKWLDTGILTSSSKKIKAQMVNILSTLTTCQDKLTSALKEAADRWFQAYEKASVKEESKKWPMVGDKKENCDDNTLIVCQLLAMKCV